MASTWNHPQWGEFKFEETGWSGIVKVPAFKRFSFDAGVGNARRSTGEHELIFEADDENDTPSPEAIALAEKVVANQAKLAPRVIDALWDDFNGEGPPSGMWWHGDLDQLADAMDADEPPEGPEDVLTRMQLSQIAVRKGVHGYDKPIVEFSFHADFEEEHGVGVLTDGEKILGTGYSHDVTPFKT